MRTTIKSDGNRQIVLETGRESIDRERICPHIIHEGEICTLETTILQLKKPPGGIPETETHTVT